MIPIGIIKNYMIWTIITLTITQSDCKNKWYSATFRRPSPDICPKSLPLGPTIANVGHELTPNSRHKYMSPSFTTYIRTKQTYTSNDQI